jgi:hypothetical protein
MGNPRWLDLGLLERKMAALRAVLLLGGIILELLLVVEVRRWNGVASTALMTSSFGGIVLWGLGGRCVMMDVCRVVELSGALEVSTAGLTKNMHIFDLKIARCFHDSDDFYRVRMRCSLKVCYTG